MKGSTKTTVTIGMFTAVLSVLSIVTIPMPSGVPFTLQTFAIALCGYVLGAKHGAAAVIIYILLGLSGIPVFSGMTAGFSRLLGYTGGFIWGFLFLVLFCGMAIHRKNPVLKIVLGLIGLFLCHLCGMLQFALLSSGTIYTAFFTVSLPYLLKDIISVIGAYSVAMPVRKAFYAGGSFQSLSI